MRRVWCATALVLASLALCYVLAPPLDTTPWSQEVRDAQGNLLRLTLATDGRYRVRTPLTGMAPSLVTATQMYEDRLFYDHPGVNPLALGRAFMHTYLLGTRRIGGSTLTMQVARLLSGAPSNTLAGKALQIFRALGLELHHSKHALLEAYLNLAPYGHNIEGAAAASLVYFGKDVARLNLAEAATLACVPQNPVDRAPDRRAPALQSCAQRLATRVCAHTPALCDAVPFSFSEQIGSRASLPFHAPHFVDWILQHGPTTPRLLTTLDMHHQRVLERILHDSVTSLSPVGIRNGAAMLVDSRDMSVRALVGSDGFLNPSIMGQVDGTHAKRSPGSTLKPLIYALAIDQGLIHPASILKDAPRRFGLFNPENFDGAYLGPLSARDALWRSRNLPAVDLLAQLHTPDLYDVLQRAGVRDLRSRDYYGLALALGGVEVTMADLVALYAALANDGLYRPLRYQRDDAQSSATRLFSAEAAYMVRDMLATARRPQQDFPTNWLADAPTVAWKTGTSYAFRDAWAVGIVGPYVLAVWMGDFSGAGNPALLARQAAAPAFFRVIDALRAEGALSGPRPTTTPLHLTQVAVCATSGQIPGPSCKHTISTLFIPGISPAAPCSLHRQAETEAWPSDMQRVFAEQGLPRRTPHRTKTRPMVPAAGNAPSIVSPQVETLYQVRVAETHTNTLPLIAHTDADSPRVHWFVDDAYLGAVKGGDPLFWSLRQGSYTLRAVDEQGRATTQRLTVRAGR